MKVPTHSMTGVAERTRSSPLFSLLVLASNGMFEQFAMIFSLISFFLFFPRLLFDNITVFHHFRTVCTLISVTKIKTGARACLSSCSLGSIFLLKCTRMDGVNFICMQTSVWKKLFSNWLFSFLLFFLSLF